MAYISYLLDIALMRAYCAKAFAGICELGIDRTIWANLIHERHTDLDAIGAGIAFFDTKLSLNCFSNDRKSMLLFCTKTLRALGWYIIMIISTSGLNKSCELLQRWQTS
jgi:hypothetical protein